MGRLPLPETGVVPLPGGGYLLHHDAPLGDGSHEPRIELIRPEPR